MKKKQRGGGNAKIQIDMVKERQFGAVIAATASTAALATAAYCAACRMDAINCAADTTRTFVLAVIALACVFGVWLESRIGHR